MNRTFFTSDGGHVILRGGRYQDAIAGQGHGINFRLYRTTDEVVLTYFKTPEVCQDCRIAITNISENTP
jgi:hypothetical protein